MPDLTVIDFEWAVSEISKSAGVTCDVPAIRAVDEVEGGVGWFNDIRASVLASDGDPHGGFIHGTRLCKVLFEAHWFDKLTNGRFRSSHPKLSSKTWDRSLYVGGQGEWERIGAAGQLDKVAALKSASYGRYQILGLNYTFCNHTSVESFVEAMNRDERAQLEAFVFFIIKKGLATELATHDWRGFAVVYNGPSYEVNDYHNKLAKAYEKHAGKPSEPLGMAQGYLRMGDKGPAVVALQNALAKRLRPAPKPDGIYGAETKNAVLLFQRSVGLKADGLAGPKTLTALLQGA